ncbi:uncharacterized protein DS421_13g412250 [Arachis hypogaea]|nr:uncharacterized protein DS421_13g412250 [Arachis hypogaea]
MTHLLPRCKDCEEMHCKRRILSLLGLFCAKTQQMKLIHLHASTYDIIEFFCKIIFLLYTFLVYI